MNKTIKKVLFSLTSFLLPLTLESCGSEKVDLVKSSESLYVKKVENLSTEEQKKEEKLISSYPKTSD